MSDPTPRLADGSEPWTPERLLERLRQLDIEAVTHAHDPVFTVEQAQALKGDLPEPTRRTSSSATRAAACGWSPPSTTGRST